MKQKKNEKPYLYKAFSVSRQFGESNIDNPKVLCVDSLNNGPPSMKKYQSFNPFYLDMNRKIPVPGQTEIAYSVESVWQGLKIVNGETDFEMFKKMPYKRPSEQYRRENKNSYNYSGSIFLYKGNEIDLVTARYLIYLPTYLYLLKYYIPEHIDREIKQTLESGKSVLFYDWDSNFNIENKSSSFSHSAIIASWYNNEIKSDFIRPAIRYLQKNTNDSHIDFMNLIEFLTITSN